MKEIIVCFSESDMKMRSEIESFFGEDVKFHSEKSLSGVEFFLVAVIPMTSLTFQIIDFFMTHFADNSIKEERLVEISKSRISIKGYKSKEVEKILTAIPEKYR